MLHRVRSHLSYANVMATIAVFIALGGTGYALSAKDKKKVRTIADREITAKAPGLSVANAASAGHANTAGSADTATSAGSADSAASATNAGNADKLDNLDSTDIGIGFITGRVDNLALTGSTGSAPSGVSAAASTTTLADQDMTLSPNRTMLMRDFTVALTLPLGCGGICGPGELATAHLEAFAPGSGSVTATINCTIAVAASTCSIPGGAMVPAGSSMRVSFTRTGDAQYTAGTDAQFSWRATVN